MTYGFFIICSNVVRQTGIVKWIPFIFVAKDLEVDVTRYVLHMYDIFYKK